MPVFHYRAIAENGDVVTGTIDSPDADAAAARLQASGVLPVSVDDTATSPGSSGLMAILNTQITPKNALGQRDRIAFTRMLATLIGAGLPLDRTLEMTREFGASKAIRRIGGRLLDAVREGVSLADAIDREAAAFPPVYRSIVRAGEAGAALDTATGRLADQLEAAARRRAALQGALIYPAFLAVTAIGSVAVLLAFVVPTFEPLLEEAGVEPPLITQVVISAGRFVESYWALLSTFVVAAIGAVRLAVLTDRGRLFYHRTALSFPLAGGVWRKFETARLARLLGMLLQNGISLQQALSVSKGALANAAFTAMLDEVASAVEDGRGLATPLAESRLLPPLATQLVQAGQESGRLTDMLLKTADIFEEEAARDVDRALAFLTPTVTLCMGALIAVIVSSILFALLRINELAL